MKKLDELRKLIEENGSVSKFLGLMLDSESTYFVKFSGATQDPLKSLIVETIHDAGVRPDLTAAEKELISGIILETLDETIMKMAKNQGTVRRSNRFFKELYTKMNESDQFSAIVASYMQDTMMDDLAKETSDGNLLAAIAMWIVCRSVLIPIVPIGETSQEVHVEQEKPVEEKKETSGTVIDAEVVDGKVVEVPLLTEEETKKEEVKSETKSEPVKEEGLESIIQKFASGLLHELESSGKVVDMGTITSSLETILKAATSTEKKEGGTVTTSASTAYKDETKVEKKTTVEIKPEPEKKVEYNENSNKESFAKALVQIKGIGRASSQYTKLADELVSVVDRAYTKVNDDPSDTSNMMKIIVSVLDAMNLFDAVYAVMIDQVATCRFSSTVEWTIAAPHAMSDFREYGEAPSGDLLARKIIAYELVKENPDMDCIPSARLYNSVNTTKISRLCGFCYLMLHGKETALVSAYKNAKPELSRELVNVIRSYKYVGKIINAASVARSINEFVSNTIIVVAA